MPTEAKHIERQATVYRYGGEDEPVTAVPRVPWASTEVQRLDGKSSLLRVRVLPPDELADQQSIEGEIWLATKPNRRPVVLRMVLSRRALWRAMPALVVLSRVGSSRAEVRLEKTIDEAEALTRVDMVAKAPGLTVEVGEVANDHAALTLHAEGAVRPGIHLVKARLHSAGPDSASVVPVVVQVSD
jgi:hypothetical protein